MNIVSPPSLDSTNMPGGIKLSLVDVKDVIAIPPPDPDGVLNGAIQLRAGASIVTINSIIPQTLAGVVTEENIEGSDFWNVQVEFAIARVSPSRMRLSKIGQRRRFLVLYHDANGLIWLCSTVKCHGRLRMAEGKSGQNPVADANQVNYIITAKLSHELYFYSSMTGGIFTSQFTQEFL